MPLILDYLNTPSQSQINPPLQTHLQTLPIDQLEWADFEKLCLRLVEQTYSRNHCEIYGVPGQKQDGIDIYAHQKDIFSAYQCKKYKKLTASDLEKAIAEFKKGSWFSKVQSFYFCTTFDMNDTKLQDAFLECKLDLQNHNIELVKWDKVQISSILKNYPQIIYDFFGKEWVRLFNGEAALHAITQKRKLDVNQIIQLRKKLLNVYSIVFQQHDPGIPSQALKSVPCLLQERFIIPDVIVEDSQLVQIPVKASRPPAPWKMDANSASFQTDHRTEQPEKFTTITQKTNYRTNIDTLLPHKNKIILLGDPGVGKSMFLRCLALDLLSEKRQLIQIGQIWGTLLPIWLPFAYITKALKEHPDTNLLELVRKWLNSIGEPALYDLVALALEDERLLLLVDGVDEWHNPNIAQIAIDRIEIFTKLKNAKLIYSSRPYGYRTLRSSFSDIYELNLAPFSANQQKQYIFYWYQKWFNSLNQPNLARAERDSNDFLTQLQQTTVFRQWAENPLLLSILIHLKLSNTVLPKNRLKILEAITEQLLLEHPTRRKVAAAIEKTVSPELANIDLQTVFEELAIHIQEQHFEGVLEKKEAQQVIQQYLQTEMGYEKATAKRISTTLLTIGAHGIGIMIEKSNDEISFIHRQFQEFLAAQYLFKADKEKTIEVIAKYGAHPNWHLTMLYFFSSLSSRKERDFQAFADAIQPMEHLAQWENQQYIIFLKYKIFLHLDNAPLKLSEQYWHKIIQSFEFETNKYTKNILWNIILEAMFQIKIGEKVRQYLGRYFPNYYAYSDFRVKALKNLPMEQLRESQKMFLIKNLLHGNEYQQLDASNTIQHFIADSWVQNHVIKLLDNCYDPMIVGYALNAMTSDALPETLKLKYFQKFQATEHPHIALFAMKLKVHLQLQTEKDLEKFIAIQEAVHYTLKDDLLEIFGGWNKNETLMNSCLIAISEDRNHRRTAKLDMGLAWEILFSYFNQSEKVINRIINELQTTDNPFLSVNPYGGWEYIAKFFKKNKKLMPIVDEWIRRTAPSAPEICFASTISASETNKKNLMDQLKPNEFTSGWYVKILAENWQNDTEVIDFLKNYISDIKNCNSSIRFVNIVFKNHKKEAQKLLKTALFDRNLYWRNLAIPQLIDLDKAYFEVHILPKFMKEELPFLPKDMFGGYYTALQYICIHFKENSIIKNYVEQLDEDEFSIHLKTQIYPNEFEETYISSQRLHEDYRLQLVEKWKEYISTDSKSVGRLHKFSKESANEVRSLAAIIYFKTIDNEDIIKICMPNVFYSGTDYQIQRQLAFSGYLIAKKIAEYFKLTKNNEIACPNFSFNTFGDDDYYARDRSKVIIKLLIDNFDYLLEAMDSNFQRLSNFNAKVQDIWGFWAKYSGESSPTCRHILNYINSNIEFIENQYLIEFLSTVHPKSESLKAILLRLLNAEILGENHTRPDMEVIGRLLGENFKGDLSVYEALVQRNNEIPASGTIIALCTGWQDSPKLKQLFDLMTELESTEQNLSPSAFNYIVCLFSKKLLFWMEDCCADPHKIKREHKYFIKPFKGRIQNDALLQQQLRHKILTTRHLSEQISGYALLQSVQAIDSELQQWRDAQLKTAQNECYGYNLLTNEWCTLKEILGTMENITFLFGT